MPAPAGYYEVRIVTEKDTFLHRVFAESDYAAAIKARQETGFMPRSEHDVEFIRAAK